MYVPRLDVVADHAHMELFGDARRIRGPTEAQLDELKKLIGSRITIYRHGCGYTADHPLFRQSKALEWTMYLVIGVTALVAYLYSVHGIHPIFSAIHAILGD